MPHGWHGELIFYNEPTAEAAPLAIVRRGRKVPFHDNIELAASRPGQQQPTREELQRRRKRWAMSYAYAFVAMVDSGSLPERFEWRRSRGNEVKRLGK
ncbi:ATP synthase alpha chain precursor [Ophiocordyceps sinensis CO18]|uniref:ATP synthase alpha chain n=1 Tax=Ophiocordyceps sinensis (strain Co18 / CGMCC 3.14243) TaxID=911162 RepID=T5APA5_OPHSC|nr:ATP synthase alpha chain precursor [Ophiocordyceps sinensis CO18]